MTEEQAEQLLQELSQMSDAQQATLDLLNNVKGYLEYLAKEKGYGRQIVEAPPSHDDGQYWNRLLEAGGEDGVPGGLLSHQREQLDLPGTLTDEEKAHIAAKIAQSASRARLAAKRERSRKRKRRSR